jgi:hypothetical protein
MTMPEAPTTALGAGPGFVVQLDAFNGPLDLLLHLLREEQIEIADIPIARIADQFLHAIHDLGLNQAADYLDMASRLVRLKAQMLLPRHSEEDGWEDPRAELVRRLLEYQQIREIAVWLGRAAERRGEQLARGYLPPPPELPPLPLTLDLFEMLQHADAGAAPGGGAAARRRVRHPPHRAAPRGARADRLARRARTPADHRGCPLHPAGPARAGQAGHPPTRATGRVRADGDRP